MANVSRIWGFRPSRYINSSPYNGLTNLYGFAAAQANVAFKGDMVVFDATNRSTGLADPYAPGIPLVAPVVADQTTTPFRGVIAGFVPAPEYNNVVTASLGTTYRLASTARYAWIIDDPAVVFTVQEVGQTYVTALNNGINKIWDVNYTAGSTISGISGAQIDSPTTNVVGAWRALRLTQTVDNFNFLATDAASFAKFDVIIANSDLANANIGA